MRKYAHIQNYGTLTEIRSALAVARFGTVSAAAESLGVHRATINQHIDTVEAHLGLPLFQRHSKGYTLTDTGQDMMEVAARADEMFTDFMGRASGVTEKLSGSLKISTLSAVAGLIIPVIKKFHLKHPNISLELIADEQLARLEHGEAHIAIRAGAKPTTPDYVVLPFKTIRFGLYASKSYIKKNGMPRKGSLGCHKFVGMHGKDS
ncbi:MAG: LysR family transcriptional regulator, partial [Pseudomonadota bacterium]